MRTLSPKLHIVRGDADSDGACYCDSHTFTPSEARRHALGASAETLPDVKVVTVAGFRIGVCHGHQLSPWGDALALSAFARKLDVDVLISGEGGPVMRPIRGGRTTRCSPSRPHARLGRLRV